MKFDIKILVIAALVITSVIATPTCPEVFGKPFEAKKAISTADALYPGDLKENTAYSTANANALKQTKAARNLLYKPHDKVTALLKAVAKNLKTLFSKNDFTSINMVEFINSEDQRQTSDAGTMQEYFLLFKNTDLIGSDLKVASVSALMDKIAGTASSSDILGFLGLIGDIGACTQDTWGRKKFSPSQQQIATILVSYVDNLKTVSEEFYNKYSPDKYYNNSAQSKPGERMSCFGSVAKKKDTDGVEKDKNMMKLDKRAGVMDSGAAADAALTPTKALPSIGWPWQTVPKKLPEFCKEEPWAGHFSGSLYELMFMMQIFAFEPNAQGKWDAKHPIDNEKKEILSALASSFLIATGMHTAIEVAVPVKNYLGVAGVPATIDLVDATKKATLKSKICSTGDNSSTDYFSTLAAKYTKATKKRKLK